MPSAEEEPERKSSSSSRHRSEHRRHGSERHRTDRTTSQPDPEASHQRHQPAHHSSHHRSSRRSRSPSRSKLDDAATEPDGDVRSDRKRRKREGSQDQHRHHRHHHSHDRSDRRDHHRSHRESRDRPDDLIPTSESLSLTSKQVPSHEPDPAPLPAPAATETQVRRDEWMLFDSRDQSTARLNEDADASARARAATEDDYFSNLGKERPKKQKEQRPDPEQLQISSRELNVQLVQGKTVDEYDQQPQERPRHGAPGHQWRMMKLRRLYEAAAEEHRAVEEVALERYASLDEFNEARAERQFLDDRDRGKGKGRSAAAPTADRAHRGTPLQNVTRRSFMFSDSPGPAAGLGGAAPSRPSSRQSFRRPGEASLPSTPHSAAPGPLARGSSFRQGGYDTPGSRSDASSTKPSTPVPSVFTPVVAKANKPATPIVAAIADESPAGAQGTSSEAIRTAVQQSEARDGNAKPILSANELNKLQARAMRAELMGASDAQTLKDEYERESVRAKSGGDQGQGFLVAGGSGGAVKPLVAEEGGGEVTEAVQVLPTLDGRGRLYDVGRGTPGDEESAPHKPGNRRKKEKFETRDPKTGELLRYNKDDDTSTLADLVRQERFGGGAKDQKDLDAELAGHIARDTRYQHDDDYIDENAERLARKKMKSDAMKRQFAIQDFAKTKRALDTCIYCWQDEGARPPRATVVSSGTRVYLAMPEYESLTEGHCVIVPMEHHLSMLEADDETWEEVKNFMKCLMQMAAKRNESLVFYETVLSLKQQKHTVIEAVPVPNEVYPVLPGIFKESLMMVEEEWSTNQKVIDFSKKPFRRSMVPQLPYFMVQWDYRGDKGYGHVIEKADGAIVDQDDVRNAFDVDEGGANGGGGDFPRWFAAEILGNQLELEPRRWRRPRRLDAKAGERRLVAFRKMWDEVDWTKMLG